MGLSPVRTVFRDVRVFDSRAGRVTGPQDVLVEGNTIRSLSPVAASAEDGATVIDGGRRTLMPGLIDAHWHSAFAAVPLQVAMTADPAYMHLVAGKTATETLLRGFTTVRDCGGPAFGLKRAIDEGVLPGPRIYPVGGDDLADRRPRRLPASATRSRAASVRHASATRSWSARPGSPTGSTRCCAPRASS